MSTDTTYLQSDPKAERCSALSIIITMQTQVPSSGGHHASPCSTKFNPSTCQLNGYGRAHSGVALVTCWPLCASVAITTCKNQGLLEALLRCHVSLGSKRNGIEYILSILLLQTSIVSCPRSVRWYDLLSSLPENLSSSPPSCHPWAFTLTRSNSHSCASI